MIQAKYVVVLSEGLEVVHLGPVDWPHADLVCGRHVVAAGFCAMAPRPAPQLGVDVIAQGESVGLNVKSRGVKDAVLISKQFLGGAA